MLFQGFRAALRVLLPAVPCFLLLFVLGGALLASPVPAAAAQRAAADDPFAIPAGLEPAVKFWEAIFLDYESDQLVFFDPRNMSRIHEVVRVKANASTRKVIRSVRARLQRRGIPSSRIRVQRGIRERFVGGVRRSGRYLEHMRRIFAARGLPLELTYLPLVESAFRNDARSFRGAVGMWQFMPATGRRYMRVTRSVDERRDPLEATRAAARLLQENYRELGTWPLAVTAYNHGRAGMKRAVRKVGTRDLAVIVKRYRSRTFKFASKNFYAEFLAAVHIMREVERHLPHVRPDPLVRFDEISLTKRVSVSSLLRHSGLSPAHLRKWNPALSRHAAWIPKGYRLKAPASQGQRFRKALATMGPSSSHPYHVVSRGDTLSGIANVYGTSLSSLQAINDLRDVDRLRVGQRLEIPARSSARSRNSKRSVKVVDKPRAVAKRRVAHKPRVAPVRDKQHLQYVVRRGDTLWDIARRHGTTAHALRRANGVKSVRRLLVGQRLEIPSRSSAKRAPVKERRRYHRVRPGETLSLIADRYRVSLTALQRANDIRNRHRIRAGQRLRIPGTQS